MHVDSCQHIFPFKYVDVLSCTVWIRAMVLENQFQPSFNIQFDEFDAQILVQICIITSSSPRFVSMQVENLPATLKARSIILMQSLVSPLMYEMKIALHKMTSKMCISSKAINIWVEFRMECHHWWLIRYDLRPKHFILQPATHLMWKKISLIGNQYRKLYESCRR